MACQTELTSPCLPAPEPLFCTTSDGWRLVLRRFAPAAGTPRAAALLTHGMMANARTLERLAKRLAELGVEAFTLDFRGHGQAAPPTARERDWSLDDHVRADLPAAIEAVARVAQLPPGELAYVGHSLGGLVGLAAGAPFRRLVLVTTGLWGFSAAPERSRTRAIAVAAFAASTRLLGFAPARALRVGTDDEPRSLVGQLCATMQRGTWRSLDGKVDYLAGLPSIRAPILSLVAAGDRLCRPADAQALLEPVAAEKILRVVGRETDLPFDPTHFSILTDARARPVWDEIGRFVF